MSAEAARLRYLTDRVSTATPAALIVMLYDRLALDIEMAATAQFEGDRIAAAAALAHAQRVVTELLTSLDQTVWTGAADLADLYHYLLLELINARSYRNPARVRALGAIVAGLRSAWQQAGSELAATTAAPLSRVG
jgi:flagellar protein FliS